MTKVHYTVGKPVKDADGYDVRYTVQKVVTIGTASGAIRARYDHLSLEWSERVNAFVAYNLHETNPKYQGLPCARISHDWGKDDKGVNRWYWYAKITDGEGVDLDGFPLFKQETLSGLIGELCKTV